MIRHDYIFTTGDALSGFPLHKIDKLPMKAIRSQDGQAIMGTEGDEGYKAACQIADKIKKNRFLIGEYEIFITISAGVVQFKPEMESFDEMIQIADNRMYQGKESGRDIVIYE